METLHTLASHQLRKRLNEGKVSPREIIESLIARIRNVDGKIRAFISVNESVSREGAKDLIACAERGALSGIPIAIKDNICVKGEETRCSSRILKGFEPPYDATVVRKLRDAGAILLGRTNMDEFAFGSSCETSCCGPTHNPWSLDRIPGGSSGGSAAAVAADETILALGSDTGGSIRQPAAMCGVVGLKPTYGRVSRYGLIAFASSLDQIGPITKDVEDSAILLQVIAGYDEGDSTSVDIPVPDYRKALKDGVKGLKIGVPKEYFIKGIDQDVLNAVNKSIEILKELGAETREITLPHTEYAVSAYYIVAPAEASSNLARFDGVQYGFRAERTKGIIDMYTETRSQGFGAEVKRRILLGTYVLSSGYYEAYYLKAEKVRTKIKEDFDSAFETIDCIITPTAPTAAFKIGEKLEDPLSMYLSDIFTIPANLAGLPAISIPCGFTKDGLPIGMQILAKPFDEETIFAVAYAHEQNTEWHKRKPPI